MAWVESHTVLMRHRKLAELARGLRIRRSHALGHLHALWHAALEQQDDGDLTDWSDEFISEMSDAPSDAPQYVRLLQTIGFLGYKDADGNLIPGTERLIHDWPDYAGRFLMNRYATNNRDKLVQIWAIHRRVYGRGNEQPESKQPATGKQPVGNPILPDQSDHSNRTNKKSRSSEMAETVPIPSSLQTPEFIKAWEKWLDYCRKTRRRPFTATSAKEKLPEFEKVGTARAIESINESIGNGWQGVFPERNKNANGYRRKPDRSEAARGEFESDLPVGSRDF